jgi:hypothetical protein
MQNLNVKPDYYTILKVSRFVKVDFFVVEIKKPNGNTCQQTEDDFNKLHREMQSILDALISMNVVEPISFGLLVRGKFLTTSHMFTNILIFFVFILGFDCVLYSMTLSYDGIYLSRIISQFRTLRDPLDMSLVRKISNTMVYLNVRISNKRI